MRPRGGKLYLSNPLPCPATPLLLRSGMDISRGHCPSAGGPSGDSGALLVQVPLPRTVGSRPMPLASKSRSSAPLQIPSAPWLGNLLQHEYFCPCPVHAGVRKNEARARPPCCWVGVLSR